MIGIVHLGENGDSIVDRSTAIPTYILSFILILYSEYTILPIPPRSSPSSPVSSLNSLDSRSFYKLAAFPNMGDIPSVTQYHDVVQGVG